MLIYGQTVNEQKKLILESMQTSRKLVRLLNDCIKTFPTLRDELLILITQEHKELADFMLELTELAKWRIRDQIDPDEPYIPPSLRVYLEGLTEEERFEYDEHVLQVEEDIIKLVEDHERRKNA